MRRIEIVEEAFHVIGPGMRTWAVPTSAFFDVLGKFLEQLLLMLAEVHGCLDDNRAQQVSLRRSPYRPDAFTAQAKQPPRLRFGRNLELDLALQGRDFHLATHAAIIS